MAWRPKFDFHTVPDEAARVVNTFTPAFRATAARSMLDVRAAPKRSDSSMGAFNGWKAFWSGTRNDASLYAQRSNVMSS